MQADPLTKRLSVDVGIVRSVTKFGDFLDFPQLFKAFGSN